MLSSSIVWDAAASAVGEKVLRVGGARRINGLRLNIQPRVINEMFVNFSWRFTSRGFGQPPSTPPCSSTGSHPLDGPTFVESCASREDKTLLDKYYTTRERRSTRQSFCFSFFLLNAVELLEGWKGKGG